MEEVTVSKLVHGGQALGELADGRKVFVWNALPGERVRVRIIKKKRSYAEAIAEEILEASSDRIAPREDNYLATSPWQIMTYAAENRYKAQIVSELFAHEKVTIPELDGTIHELQDLAYRNKMEYSFWGDDDGLHLALHMRGSHGKQIVQGSLLAIPALDTAAQALLESLNVLYKDNRLRASDLKTVIVRVTESNAAVAALYTKLETFPELPLPKQLQGLKIYHSNPKSPASIGTRLLQEYGDTTMQDSLFGKQFSYAVEGFFQVNLPIYERALGRIRQLCQDDPVDMYAGVGSIGLSVAKEGVELIEVDPAAAAMARKNLAVSGLTGRVVEIAAEQATGHIACESPLIVDPPRAGLHPKFTEAVLAILPPQIIYLSCNPATQARDLVLLQESYTITFFEVYNFFPRTPHIETLAVLQLRGSAS
jgi:23S rRNA (uracil1939-C5)-methyltransferase